MTEDLIEVIDSGPRYDADGNQSSSSFESDNVRLEDGLDASLDEGSIIPDSSKFPKILKDHAMDTLASL